MFICLNREKLLDFTKDCFCFFVFFNMPTYTSTQPEIFTCPPKKPISSSSEKKPGQLTEEQVKQYFDEVKLINSPKCKTSFYPLSIILMLQLSLVYLSAKQNNIYLHFETSHI